jgi:hypothetical protein
MDHSDTKWATLADPTTGFFGVPNWFDRWTRL